jgi:type VI secretion system protein ImpH
LRLILGPLSLAEYLDFLPGSRRFHALRDWLALYLRDPLDVRLALRLQCDAIPVSALNARAALGRNCWLGSGDEHGRRPRKRDSVVEFPVHVTLHPPSPVGSARTPPAETYL